MPDNLVNIQALSFHSQGDPSAHILNNVTFSIAPRDKIALIGANGSGKTTLLRLLSGDRHIGGAMQGSISFSGLLKSRTGAVGYVRQRPSLFPWLRIDQNIAFGTTLSGGKVLDHCDLTAHMSAFDCLELARKYPVHLSGGETQRVALAQALFSCPTLLLLDEPFSAMDVPTKTSMVCRLRSMWEEHEFAMVLVGHDFRDIIRLADRVVVLRRNSKGSTITKEFSISDKEREAPSFIKQMLWEMSEATSNNPISA